MEMTIDADGHVLEPWAAWEGLPDEHRPHVATDDRGLDHVRVAGTEVFVARLGQMGTPGTDVGAPGPPRCRRSGATASRATCWCCTPSPTPSSRCSPAHS